VSDHAKACEERWPEESSISSGGFHARWVLRMPVWQDGKMPFFKKDDQGNSKKFMKFLHFEVPALLQ